MLVLHEGETEGGHKLWEATGRTSHEQATKGIFNRTDIHLVEAKCISLYKTVFFFKKNRILLEKYNGLSF